MAEEKNFLLGGTNVTLTEVTTDVGVRYAAMRFNPVNNRWNLDMSLTNKSYRMMPGPLVVLVQEFSGTTGPLQPDGRDGGNPERAYYDFTALATAAQLWPGETTGSRPIVLGFNEGSPNLHCRVFANLALAAPGLASARTLNERGQPLPDVIVSETGPNGSRETLTDPAFALATLGGFNGEHTWEFSKPNHLSVWRRETLRSGEVALLFSPRLVRRAAAVTIPLAGGQVAGNSITVQFPAGAFSGNATAALTPLTAQTLPALLPLGWSPLQAWTLELSAEPTQPVGASVSPWGAITPSESAALVRWNAKAFQWDVLQVVSGNQTNSLALNLPGSGTFALVVADGGSLAPPTAQVGQSLLATSVALPDYASLTATGSVMPAVSLASVIPELVTATASIRINSLSNAIPSGLPLRCEVGEDYRLSDGTRRTPPQYENFLIGYQRPGDADLKTLATAFPMQPLLLFGRDVLDQATVSVDVLPPAAFAGRVLDQRGGLVPGPGVVLQAAASDLTNRQAIQIRPLEITNFTDSVSLPVISAFDLSLSGVAAGHRLSVQFSALPTNSLFVLAKVRSTSGQYGLEPVERLQSNGTGTLSSLEPGSGERLPGITGAGQYLLLQVTSPQALVTGFVHNSAGQAVAGLPVRVTGQPWLTYSATNGAYRLVAPAGPVEITTTDPATGDLGSAVFNIADPNTPATANANAVPTGPRVVSLSPTNNAANVARALPIIIRFSEAINPGSLGTNGVVLTTTNAQPVAASLTFNLQNTILTLIPSSQLAASTTYRILLSSNLTDTTGLPLEGPRQFAFTTESDVLDRLVAQVISYEPANGFAAMYGSPGTAEPNSAVILVNETSGQTATILSKPDGSFSNSIPANVEDFLSAVLVNKNGTRNTIPVSRQLFRDGSVGLFNGGGILEAQSDGGPVQVIIEPGAIPNRTRFTLAGITLTNFMAGVGNTSPEQGVLAGTFRLKMDGDALTTPPKLRLAIATGQLNLPPGEDLANQSYIVVRPMELQGQVVYEYVGSAQYTKGDVTAELRDTRSSASAGAAVEQLSQPKATRNPDGVAARFTLAPDVSSESWGIAMRRLIGGGDVEISGTVQSVLNESDGTPQPNSERRVPGAVVVLTVDDGLFRNGVVNPGALVGLVDDTGKYRLMKVVNQLQGASFLVAGLSALFPSQSPSAATTYFAPADQSISQFAKVNANLNFSRNPTASASVVDNLPPTLSVAHTPLQPRTNDTVTLRILANDETSLSQVTATVNSVQEIVFHTAPTVADVQLTLQRNGSVNEQTVRAEYSVSTVGGKPLRTVLAIKATDNGGHQTSINYPLEFSDNPPPPVFGDTNDHTGPFVVASAPALGEEDVPPGTPIEFTFSEPLDPAFQVDPASCFALAPAPTTLHATYFPDTQKVRLTFSPQRSGQTYTLTINSNLRDVNGNPFDQNPYNNPVGTNATPVYDSFTLRFHTADLPQAAIPGVANGGGVLFRDRYLYVVDRKPGSGNDGRLSIYSVDDPANPQRFATYGLGDYPRDFVLVPGYSYKTRLSDPVKTDDLLIVAGGLVGGDGQWLEVINVSDPTQPRRVVKRSITPSPAAVVIGLRWSAPLLGVLVSEGDVHSLQMVNLQLLIYSANLTGAELAQEPLAGNPGLDANGDGDYVDPGDVLPRPRSQPGTTTVGLLNSGLVETYSMQGETRMTRTTQRILDFDQAQNGRLVEAIVGPGVTLNDAGQPTTTQRPAGLWVFASGGNPVSDPQGGVTLNGDLKRTLLLMGAGVDTPDGPILANLALVSAVLPDGNPGIFVVDVTAPTAPAVSNVITLAARHGVPYSMRQRENGVIVLATARDLILLDPRSLLVEGDNDGTRDHPAVIGEVPGAGMGGRAFAVAGTEFYAVAFGGLSRMLGTPPVVNLVMRRPGTMGSRGPVVPEEAEEDPLGVIVFVNDDYDGTTLGLAPNTRDNQRVLRSTSDNDLICLTLRRIPTRLNGRIPKKITLWCSSPGAQNSAVAILSEIGSPVPFTSTSSGDARLEDASEFTGAFFRRVKDGDVQIFLEGVTPCDGVVVKFQVWDDSNRLLGEDTVKLTVVQARVTQIWSDQFPGSKSNLYPGNVGDSGGQFLLMGNRADGTTHVGCKIEFLPANSAALSRLKGALYLPDEQRLIGTSTLQGDELYVQALDDRSTGITYVPVLFSGLWGFFSPPVKLEEFLIMGLDYDGDGVLSKSEMQGGLGFVIEEAEIRTQPIDGLQRFQSYHFKVVPKSLYDAQALTTSAMFALVQAASSLSALNNQPIGKYIGDETLAEIPPTGVLPLAATFMSYFLFGDVIFSFDNSPMKPQSTGTYQVPDNVHRVSGRTLQDHNVGEFRNGFHAVPFLQYALNSSFSVALRDSRTVTDQISAIVRDNDKESPKLARLRGTVLARLREAASQMQTGVVNFTTTYTVPAEVGLTGDFSSDTVDLHYGIGGFNYQRMDLVIAAHVQATPYVLGETIIQVDRIDYYLEMQDLYDWNMKVNPIGGILEAGEGVYGSVGKPFVWQCPVQGTLNPSSFTLK